VSSIGLWGHLTETSEAYLAGYFFPSDGHRPERRFNAVVNKIEAYAKASSAASAPLAPLVHADGRV
jgi:hypothetical protein